MSLINEDIQWLADEQLISDNLARLNRAGMASDGLTVTRFVFLDSGLAPIPIPIPVKLELQVPIPKRSNWGRHSISAISSHDSTMRTASADSQKRAKNHRLGRKN